MTSEVYYVPWEDIVFGNGEIRLKSGPNTRNRIIRTYKDAFTIRNIRQGLEQVKELFKSDPPQKFFVKNNEIQANSPFFASLKALVDFAIYTGAYKLPDYKPAPRGASENVFSDFNTLTLKQQQTILLKSIKSEYLRLILPLQINGKRIIFIQEKNGETREDCFIFTAMSNENKEVLIWESSIEARATHIFNGGAESEKNLKRYIMCEGTNKRQRLWNSDPDAKKLKEDLNYIGSIKHEFPDSFHHELVRKIKS